MRLVRIALGRSLPFTCLALVMHSSTSYSAAPDFVWERFNQRNGVYYDVDPLADGSCVVSGRYSAGSSIYPGVIKYDPDGQELWSWEADVPSGTMRDVKALADGNIAAVGGVSPIAGLPTYQLLVILDDEGNELSRFWFDFEEPSGAYCFVELPDGGFVVGGTILLYDVYTPTLTRVSPEGSVVWSVEPDDLSGAVRTVILTDQGTLMCIVDPSYEAPVLIEYTLEGEATWSYDCTGHLQSGDGDFCAHGSDGGYAIVSYRHAMAINSTGELLWLQQPTGSNNRELFSVSQAIGGGLILAGADHQYEWYEPYQYHAYNGWIIKLDSEGNTDWHISRDPGSGHTFYYSAKQNQAGGYIVAGSNDGFAYLGLLAPETGIYSDPQPSFSSALCENPFSSEIRVSLVVSEPDVYDIQVFDLCGRLLGEISTGELAPGSHSLSWQPAESGGTAIYLVRIANEDDHIILRAVRL